MRCLAINTYAGSLLQAATGLGMEVHYSLEDGGFGQGIAKENFPLIEHIEKEKNWPDLDLSETVVIAHPPCSAFSLQNVQKHTRGVDSEAFACTKRVLDYAMGHNAVAIAVESVPGALPGAYFTHQRYADDNGYHIYRILQNGAMWGCQWRERFWVIYVKKGATRPELELTVAPRFKTVQQVISGHEDGPAAGNLDVLLARQKVRLVQQAKLTDDDMRYLFEPPPHHPTKALGTVLFEYKFETPKSTVQDKIDVFAKYVGTFTSGTMVYLDPRGLAPVLMGGSFWYINGRCLSENGFKRIMGYPADYTFPIAKRNYRGQLRMFLSKGVMPPVARWILEQVTLHLGWRGPNHAVIAEDTPSYHVSCDPDTIADLRIKKQDWWERDQRLPPLRAEAEDVLAQFKKKMQSPEAASTSLAVKTGPAGEPNVAAKPAEPQPETEPEPAPPTRMFSFLNRLDRVKKFFTPKRDEPFAGERIETVITDEVAPEPARPKHVRVNAESAGPAVEKLFDTKFKRPAARPGRPALVDVPLVELNYAKISTRGLRFRVLKLAPNAVPVPKNDTIIEQRRAKVLEIVQERGAVEFDDIVQLALKREDLGGIAESTVLDYVRNLVRDGILVEAR